MKRRIWIILLALASAGAVTSCGSGRGCDCP